MSQTFEIALLPPLTDPLPLRSVAHPTTFTDTMEKTLQELQAIFISINLDFIPKLNEMAEPISVVITNLELIQSVPTLAANAASSALDAAASASAAADSQAVCEGIKEVLTEGATVEATPNRPSLRNNRGASQFADPVEDMDAANKQWTEGQIGAMAAGMAWPEHNWELLPNLDMRWFDADRTGQYLAGSGATASTACFVSTDYGESQTQRTLPASAIYSHWGVSGADLILCSSTTANVAYQSKNSGASWSVPGAVTSLGSQPQRPCVASFGNNAIFVVHVGNGANPQVRVTTDKGASWSLHTIIANTAHQIYGVFCTSKYFIALLTDANLRFVVYKCAIGASSWSAYTSFSAGTVLAAGVSDAFCLMCKITNYNDSTSKSIALVDTLVNLNGLDLGGFCSLPSLSGAMQSGAMSSIKASDVHGKYGIVPDGPSSGFMQYKFTRDYGVSWNTYSFTSEVFGSVQQVRITDAGIYWGTNSNGIYVCRDYGQEAA